MSGSKRPPPNSSGRPEKGGLDLVYLPTRLNGSNEVIAEHRTDHGYDERHRLTSISHSVCPVTAGTHTCTATPVATGSVNYLYDDNDNRTRVNEANGAGSLDRHYCYDALNRLISTRSATGCSTGLLEMFEYDAAGNRTRASLSAPQYFRYSTRLVLTRVSPRPCRHPR